jgi:hypothetical protein
MQGEGGEGKMALAHRAVGQVGTIDTGVSRNRCTSHVDRGGGGGHLIIILFSFDLSAMSIFTQQNKRCGIMRTYSYTQFPGQ